MCNLSTSVLFLLLLISSCSPRLIPEITHDELKKHIEFLASDELAGRYPGTLDDSIMASFISKEFSKYGMKAFNNSYVQKFQFLSGISPDQDNSLHLSSHQFVQGEDFYPFSFSGNGEINAMLVYAGYGFDFETDEYKRNDYKYVDPNGKWVIILRGEPENHPALLERSRDRDKAMLAQEKGAAGVLLVSGEEFSATDDLPKNLIHEPEISIPVVAITREALNKILQEVGTAVSDLEKNSKTEVAALPVPDQKLRAKIKVAKVYSSTGNILGYLEGTNTSKKEWIVIGAHHDHLGMGGQGSSSRMPDTIAVHYGADDNASGVASLLELAEYFSKKENRPMRNLLFITFGAEEKGLLGSRYFINHSPIGISGISAMINLDMVGRMKEDSSLQVGGVGTSAEGKSIISRANDNFHFKLSVSEAGYGPSDHASFYYMNIPVFFISTGAHGDYHTPEDDPSKINYSGLSAVTEFTASLIKNIDQEKNKLVFQEAGPKTNTSRSFRNRITLGIMPDVSGESKDGMAVLAVTPGKPADIGGMKKGDIITGIEGKSISNVYDYMYRLNELKSGDRIIVSVKRNNSTIDLLIQL